jgi:hypothetical protein
VKVISFSEAARLAGVSKQAINQLKARHADGKGEYTFFTFSPGDGLPGVDIDNPTWKHYVNRRTANRIRKRGKTESAFQKDLVKYIIEILNVTAEVVQEVTGASDEQISEIKQKVASRYV